MALDLRRILFPLNILRTKCRILFPAHYLENKSIEFHQILFMKLYSQDLSWIVTHLFWHICTRVMALDLRQNSVSTKYLEDKWAEFDQTLYNNLY